jgi:hypothetical protein
MQIFCVVVAPLRVRSHAQDPKGLVSWAAMRKLTRRSTAAVVFASVLSVSAQARADEWYGWQTLTSDAATITLAYGVSKLNGDVAGVVAAVGYVGAPVVIHIAHEELGRAAASGGIRVVLPLGGLITGAVVGGSGHDLLGMVGGGLFGFLAGIIAASAIDAAALAWKTD